MNGMQMMLKSMGVDMGQVEKVVQAVQQIAARLEHIEQQQAEVLAMLKEGKQDGRGKRN